MRTRVYKSGNRTYFAAVSSTGRYRVVREDGEVVAEGASHVGGLDGERRGLDAARKSLQRATGKRVGPVLKF